MATTKKLYIVRENHTNTIHINGQDIKFLESTRVNKFFHNREKSIKHVDELNNMPVKFKGYEYVLESIDYIKD